MSRRSEVTNAILNILTDEVEDVEWSSRITGADRGKKARGTITCDHISFTNDDKENRMATATYYIYLVDSESIESVDPLADEVIESLTRNVTLDDWATDSRIKEITYGQAPGATTIGAALILFEVTYDWN